MPRRPVPESAEDRAIREIDAEDEAALTKLALEAGPPPDSEWLSERDLDEVWAIEDRLVSADPDGFAQALMTTGIDQQTLPRLRVLKEQPEWAPLYGQPTQDAEMADQLTRLAQFPHRWGLLVDIDDPEDQVRLAERLDRRYQRAHAERQAQADMPIVTPTPAEMAPSVSRGMPEAVPEQPMMGG